MKVIIAGGSGLVGHELIKLLLNEGHSITVLSRSDSPDLPDETLNKISTARWDTENQKLDASVIDNSDAVVNLSGQGIADKRWTDQRKKELLNSRIQSTTLLAKTILEVKNKPKTFISASAIGYYNPSGDQRLIESSPPGDNFISKICLDWEKAARLPEEEPVRCVQTRIGIVLSKKGGALKKILLPFQLGLGGKLGSGEQYMSWISLEDIARALYFCLTNEKLKGPVNLCSPEQVTNHDFTKTLGKTLSRPTILPVPKWALRLALGEMADQLLLASLRVSPQKLKEAGFQFKHPKLNQALKDILN